MIECNQLLCLGYWCICWWTWLIPSLRMMVSDLHGSDYFGNRSFNFTYFLINFCIYISSIFTFLNTQSSLISDLIYSGWLGILLKTHIWWFWRLQPKTHQWCQLRFKISDFWFHQYEVKFSLHISWHHLTTYLFKLLAVNSLNLRFISWECRSFLSCYPSLLIYNRFSTWCRF